MVIDAHVHVGFQDGKDYTPEDLLASMDAAGIDYAIVLANKTKGDAQLSTEEAIQIARTHPRLKAVGNVEWDSFGNKQIKHLLDYLEKNQICGVKLYAGYEDYYWTDTKLFPLYASCQENGKPVIFHTGVLQTGYPGLLKQSHPLLADEVAYRFPRLKLILAHSGNPWILDCAAVVAKNEHVYADLSGYFTEYSPISKEESELFRRQLSEFKTFVGDFNKCLFGTDWPLYSQSEYGEVVRSLNMTDEEKEHVFYRNAKELFGIDI